MNFPIAIPIILGVLLVIALAVYYNWRTAKKRREAMQELANDLGFTFHLKDDTVLQSWFEGFHLFPQGRSRKLFNILRGKTQELDLAIFDYRYTTGRGKNQQTHSLTVLCFNSANLQLPAFVMRPESFWHRIGMALLGGQDIDFDTHPDFSKMFLLRGKDEVAIRETFNVDVLEHFEQFPGISVEGEENLLIYYRNGTKVAADKIRPFMEEGFETLKQFSNR